MVSTPFDCCLVSRHIPCLVRGNMLEGRIETAGEREELIALIRAYDSFYITVNFSLYTLEELKALKQSIDAEKIGSK